MKIAIVGAGIAGLTAAWELVQKGHTVTLYEAASYAGGLAAGFRDSHWDWHLERYYHHLFETDTAIKQLVEQIGARDKLFFTSPTTAHYWNGGLYGIDSPTRILQFPGIPFIDRLRFGLAVGYLKYLTNDWRSSNAQRQWHGPNAGSAPPPTPRFCNHCLKASLGLTPAR